VGIKNAKFLELDNVEIKVGDVINGIDETDVDLITYDLPDPWLALPAARKALKVGGFLVSYSPMIPQTADFVNNADELGCFEHVKTVEIIEREWEVKRRNVRPKSRETIHSGFLTLLRKIT